MPEATYRMRGRIRGLVDKVFQRGKIFTGSLEFFLTDRCNLRCAHCAASSPYLRDPAYPDLTAFEESLGYLSRIMRAGQIKFLGGEPLLNRAINHFLRAAKRAGMFDRIRVTTNGVLLAQMDEIF